VIPTGSFRRIRNFVLQSSDECAVIPEARPAHFTMKCITISRIAASERQQDRFSVKKPYKLQQNATLQLWLPEGPINLFRALTGTGNRILF
jgi:hypothetical protein